MYLFYLHYDIGRQENLYLLKIDVALNGSQKILYAFNA